MKVFKQVIDKFFISSHDECIHQLPNKEMNKSSSSFVSMSSTYNDNSETQAHAALLMCQLISKVTENILLTDFFDAEAPLTIAEYGCATGSSSLAPLDVFWKKLGKKKYVNVIMNDLPLNDWGILYETLEPIKHHFRNLLFKKMSMYEGIVVKPNTLHIGYSCFAQHWLNDGSPTEFPFGSPEIWPQQLSCLETKKKWTDAAMKDWAQFLEYRFEELVSGGYVVIIIQASRDDGSLSEKCAHTLMKVKELMMIEGSLSPQDAAKMIMPEYLKTKEEILVPFKSEPNISRWDVEEILFTELECQLKKSSMDRIIRSKEVVKRQIDSCRSFMDSSLIEAIGESKVGLFWDSVETFVGENSNCLETNYSIVQLVLKKK